MAQPKFVRVDDAGKITTPGVVQQMTDIAKANGGGLPAGGTAGQVLQKTATGAAWAPAPTSLPAGGSTGQAVIKQADGSAAWDNASGPAGRGIKSIVSSTSDPTKATVTYTDNTTEVITLPAGPAGKSIKSFGTPDPATGVSTVTFSDNTTTTITLPKGPKGDPGAPGSPGKDGANWSKDQQAKAQGYWIVVSPTEPASGTYTTADGTVVPVIWQKPIEKMVPVIPEAPYFDKYALSIQVASLVGVDYYLTGFTKDGATVDVPDVKIPDGGILKLADVSGKPALPYTVNVEARAEPGYLLPNALTWSYSVADPSQVSLVTSETFVRDVSPSPLVGSSTDARLGGAPLVWQKTWEQSAGAAARHSVQDGVLRTNLSLPDASATLHGIGQNQRVEFDFTLEAQKFPWSASEYLSIISMGATTSHQLNSTASLHVSSWFEGKAQMVVRFREGSPYTLPSRLPSQLNGHYVVELLEQSVVVSMPGMAPVTIPVTRLEREVSTGIRIGGGKFSQETFCTYDNFKFSKIGF